MKIIGFAGSTSSKSINKKLVSYTLGKINNDSIQTELLDLNNFKCPLFNVDVEDNEGYPDNATSFINKLKEADAFIISMAEHNGSYAAEVKNLLDWCSRIELKFFNGKPMFLMSTSPGGYGGGNVQEAAQKQFPKFDAEIRETFKLPSFYDNFEQGEIKSEELKADHQEKLSSFLSSLD